MTTSGTTTQEFKAIQIVEHAYARAGFDVQNLGYGHMVRAREVLQLIFWDWENRANFPWKQALRTVTLVEGTTSYDLLGDVTDILDMVFRPTSGSDVPMVRIAQSDYLAIPNKDDTGRPDRYYLRRDIPLPKVFVWKPADASLGSLVYYCITALYDVTASRQTLDIAKRWTLAVVTRLAYELKPYIVPAAQRDEHYQNDRTVLRGEMNDALDFAIEEDRDTATLGIYPDGWDSPST